MIVSEVSFHAGEHKTSGTISFRQMRTKSICLAKMHNTMFAENHYLIKTIRHDKWPVFV